jgi:glycosyltransferase involved in cell wall biosynthesis
MLAELPVVSVLMITCNHEPFVLRAIESVFAQDFNGPMELVIGEDCSADNTRAIIEDVCRKALIHVRLLESEQNVGMHANARCVQAECRGKYLALF